MPNSPPGMGQSWLYIQIGKETGAQQEETRSLGQWQVVTSALAARRALVSWGVSGTASSAQKQRRLSCSALHWGSLTLTAGGSSGCHNIRRISNLSVLSVQREGTKMVEGLKGKRRAAEVTFVVPCVVTPSQPTPSSSKTAEGKVHISSLR